MIYNNWSHINWSDLKVCGNDNASHVPRNLNELCSDDFHIRNEAYWQLDNWIVVQGGLREAAYYTIVPLLEVLERDESKEKDMALELLLQLVMAADSDDYSYINVNGESIGLQSSTRRLILQNEERIRNLKIDMSKVDRTEIDPRNGHEFTVFSEATELEEILDSINDLKEREKRRSG
ncbi:MAG: hypothetical protein JNL32_01580 [Candidatus Kapabacteria bacterium]|nr:hypothetical protein [Candidatus Kapabacteria bacterium]